MEKAFLQDRLVKDPYQDPMGYDAHQGLERWLDKFHQPTVPNYTIITDPEYSVFLWFHDAMGNLIDCPYVKDGWTPKLEKSAVPFGQVNKPLDVGIGIQSGTEDPSLPVHCVDLTPFVRQATLPEIKPANGEIIDTLFGKTSAGAFSPYASDGQQTITLQMVDTEFSILDSLFYPWMKDINSPWWYRPDRAYTEWATPYPMATLEVQRPRMRYNYEAEPMESRKDDYYIYYSYKYIGVKPTSYAAFEVNGNGVSNLLRSLNLSCDMCLVDLTGDVAGTGAGTTNLGANRTGFFFANEPSPGFGDGEQPDQDEEDEDGEDEGDLEDAQNELKEHEREEEELQDEIDQQEEGDMPGEDEDEWDDEEDEDYDEDEYEDEYGDDETQDSEMDEDEEDYSDDMANDEDFDNSDWEDDSEPWEDGGMGDDMGESDDPNRDLDDYTMEQEADAESDYGEPDYADEVQDGMMDVGNDEASASAEEGGWLADDAEGGGLEPSMMDEAIGGAVDLAQSGVDLVTDAASTTLDVAGDVAGAVADKVGSLASGVGEVASTVAQKAVGAVGSLASAAANAFKPSSPQAQANQDAQTPEAGQKEQEGGLLSTVGNALNGALGKAQTAFGTVSNAVSAVNGHAATVGGVLDKALSSAFTATGSIVGNAANVLGGAMSKVGNGAVGALQQVMGSKLAVGTTKVMANSLNAAANTIASSTQVVSDVAASVQRAASQSSGTSIDPVGRLITRMTTSYSGKPTPLEDFVGMVTKQNARGSTRA